MKTQKSLKNHARQKHGNCKNTEKHGKPSRFRDYLYCHSVTSHDAANAAHLLESQGSWRPTWTVGRLPSSNRIRSKSDKTKFICLSGRDQLAKIYVKFLGIRFPEVRFSSSVWDLNSTELSALTHSSPCLSDKPLSLHHVRRLLPLPHDFASLIQTLICIRVDFNNTISIAALVLSPLTKSFEAPI